MPSREKTSVFYKGYKKPLTPPPSFCPIFIQVRTTFSRLSGGFQRFSAVFGCLSGGFRVAHRTNQNLPELFFIKKQTFSFLSVSLSSQCYHGPFQDTYNVGLGIYNSFADIFTSVRPLADDMRDQATESRICRDDSMD